MIGLPMLPHPKCVKIVPHFGGRIPVLLVNAMILKRGITSFFNWDQRGTIPEFPFTEFTRVVYAIAGSLRLEVSRLTERQVTQNFHFAQLSNSDMSTLMLGHSTYPLIAFSETANLSAYQLRFVNRTDIAKELQNLFPNLTIADACELSRKLTETDLVLLDEVERDQIKYWKPTTVGEVAFNSWD